MIRDMSDARVRDPERGAEAQREGKMVREVLAPREPLEDAEWCRMIGKRKRDEKWGNSERRDTCGPACQW